MKLKKPLHGIQYYRSPTPLKDEWNGDLDNIRELGIDVIQIRINWRNNERREGEYNFDDVDELMRLAKDKGLKVIIKFLLECAPQYVFEKYGGTRIGPKGEQIRGGSHGAFYTGGWIPCFTNPEVKKAAIKFVEKVAERYNDYDNIVLWNAWNEPRNRPIEECFCPHCRKAYGEHLKKRFKTIEALNDYFGVAEESFETIALPAMAHGYWDMFTFKQWSSGQKIHDNLRFVYDAVRKYDKVRPIMSHVGVCAAFQASLGDISDDDTIASAVDFYGTSIPFDTNMDSRENRLDMLMLTDYMRSLDPEYFVHEIYPGLGFFKYYDTPFDLSFKQYAALGGGAKGICYWQYRAERVGMENDCAGIASPDGTLREVAYEVKDFGIALKKHSAYFESLQVKKADIAILFDYNSSLMSLVEDNCGNLYDFAQKDALNYYRRSLCGFYRLLKENDYRVDFIRTAKLGDINDYKAVYLPYYCMIDEETAKVLTDYVEQGGIIIADEGFGLRTQNTWLQPYDIQFKPAVTARIARRRQTETTVVYGDKTFKAAPYRSDFSADGETIALFDDGKPAARKFDYGKGSVYLFGFSLGYSYESAKEATSALVSDIIAPAGVKKLEYACAEKAFFTQDLTCEGGKLSMLLNASSKPVEINVEGVKDFGDGITADGTKITIAPFTCSFVFYGE